MGWGDKPDAMELSTSLPEEYEERMLSASLDCNRGAADGDACHAVGEFFAVIRKDYVKAREAYGANCDERKHGASCFGLGRLLLGGKGGGADEKAGEAAFDKGCALGHGPSCHHLGLLEFKRKDDTKALGHLETACGAGDPGSCYLLGSYFLKPGKSKAPLKAKTFLETACADGHAPACHNLAVMFKNGDAGVPKDEAKFDTYAKRTRALVDAAGAARGVKVA